MTPLVAEIKEESIFIGFTPRGLGLRSNSIGQASRKTLSNLWPKF